MDCGVIKMSNFVSIGIRNVVRAIKVHKYKYRDDEDYIKKIDEYERSLIATLNEIEDIELKMELNMKHADSLSIHELTDMLENGIGGLMYYYYGIREYLSTVSNTLHNREMREVYEMSKLMEEITKKEILKVYKGGNDVSED
jgi:hypothetical protein